MKLHLMSLTSWCMTWICSFLQQYLNISSWRILCFKLICTQDSIPNSFCAWMMAVQVSLCTSNSSSLPLYLCIHPISWCAHCSSLWPGGAGPARTWSGAIQCSRSGSASLAPRSQTPGSTLCLHSLWYAHRVCFSEHCHCSALEVLCRESWQHSLCHAPSCRASTNEKQQWHEVSWERNRTERSLGCAEIWELL